MKQRPPAIVVQLVHIEGPLKGEIQEFSAAEIMIGRQPSCQVRFPRDLAIISREHARIVRDGNRFMVLDSSANGTFVNGKRVSEAYLKDGDVLTFAESGPKVSFLTRMGEELIEADFEPPPPPRREIGIPAEPELQSTVEHDIPAAPVQPPPVMPPQQRDAVRISVESVEVPVIVQYGPTLQSFKQVPVAIGRSPQSDFVLDHPAVLDRHAQIFFHQNQYWVKDLTGQRSVLINGRPVDVQAPLTTEDELALSPQGPFFRFLGGGRLAEVEDRLPEDPSRGGLGDGHEPGPEPVDEKSPKRPKSILKKFLDR